MSLKDEMGRKGISKSNLHLARLTVEQFAIALINGIMSILELKNT